jgi:hypothetical protein
MDLLVALVERVRSLFSMTTRSPGALKARLRKAANADRRRMAVTAEMLIDEEWIARRRR